MKRFGVVGLGRIGGGLALQALSKGYEVVGYDLQPPSSDLKAAGLIEANSLGDLVAQLQPPRCVLVYVHAGPVVQKSLEDLVGLMEPGDILADGGNSYWGDSVRRAKAFSGKVRFLDVGTSGGLLGASTGACFMVGGPKEAASEVEPLLRDLAVPGGYVYAGGPGAGHFVKLVHNGIEFGMLQAIGEGVHLLTAFDEKLPIPDVLTCWTHGSVIRSWLVELMAQHLEHDPELSSVPAYIEDTGEVNWLVADAMRMEVPIPVITQSVIQLFASRDRSADWAKAIAAMRRGFGGHPFGPDPTIAHERQTARLGDIYRPGE